MGPPWLCQHPGDGVTPRLPSILRLQMVEYKSARDVETFSKFLENGGTLPEEPPTVSEVPPPRARDPHRPWGRILWDGGGDR